MDLALGEGPEGPQTGEYLLERLVDTVVLGLFGLLGVGGVEPRAVEARQVLVVGAGTVAQRLLLRKRCVHRGQRVDNPLRALRVLDVIAQVIEHVVLHIEVCLEVGVGQHGLDVVIEAVCFHELVIEVERHCEPVGDRSLRKAQRSQYSHVGRLYPERLPVPEAHIAEGCDLCDRQIALRPLGLGWPQ